MIYDLSMELKMTKIFKNDILGLKEIFNDTSFKISGDKQVEERHGKREVYLKKYDKKNPKKEYYFYINGTECVKIINHDENEEYAVLLKNSNSYPGVFKIQADITNENGKICIDTMDITDNGIKLKFTYYDNEVLNELHPFIKKKDSAITLNAYEYKGRESLNSCDFKQLALEYGILPDSEKEVLLTPQEGLEFIKNLIINPWDACISYKEKNKSLNMTQY